MASYHCNKRKRECLWGVVYTLVADCVKGRWKLFSSPFLVASHSLVRRRAIYTFKVAVAAARAATATWKYWAYLLNNDRQVHAGVNSTVEMKRASGSKWANRWTITAVERYVYAWSPAFFCRLLCTANPTTICNDMRWCCVINQIEHITFVDGNGALGEVGAAHVHWRPTGHGAGVYDGARAQ